MARAASAGPSARCTRRRCPRSRSPWRSRARDHARALGGRGRRAGAARGRRAAGRWTSSERGRCGRAAARSAAGGGARGRRRCSGSAATARSPHGHGFVAATSMKRVGKIAVRWPRTIATRPSSSGWRSASSAGRGNSRELVEEQHAVVGEARLAGRRDRAAADEAGRGDRVVRRAERPRLRSRPRRRAAPAMLWIRVTSSASARVSGGRIDGSRRASIVLPVPGGPEAAGCGRRRRRSSARRSTSAWPRTSARSACGRRGASAGDAGSGGGGRSPPRRTVGDLGERARRRRRRARRRAPPRRRARAGRRARRGRRARAPSATASAPRHGRSSPPSESSPKTARRSSASAGTWPLAASTPHGDREVEAGPGLAQVRGREVDGDAPLRGTRSPS